MPAHRSRRTLLTALALLLLAAPGVASGAPGGGDALVLRAPGGALRLVDPATGHGVRNLPAGAVSADGRTLLTATVHGRGTAVRRISIASGRVLASRTIPGAWGFQRAAEDGTLVAGGDHGLPVVLVAAARANGYRGTARTTRIAILPSTLRGPSRLLELAGNLGVDAVGPDGHYLYLIEHLQGEHYQVRAYDLRAGRMESQVVVDKREPNEKMQGLPMARSASGDWVLTLYERPSGVPFVHALMASSLFAFCIDLPVAARVDVSDPSSWGVVVHGTTLSIANAATGWLGVVELSTLTLVRSESLGAQAPAGRVARPLAMSPDGTRLYLARPQGLVSIDVSTLAPSAPFSSLAFGSLALGSAGTVLYGQGGGAIRALDPLTGAAEGTPWSTGRSTLVGIVAT
jgi:hypothetical protein